MDKGPNRRGSLLQAGQRPVVDPLRQYRPPHRWQRVEWNVSCPDHRNQAAQEDLCVQIAGLRPVAELS